MSYPDQLTQKVESIANKHCGEYKIETHANKIVLKINLNKATNESALRQDIPTQDYPIEVRGWF